MYFSPHSLRVYIPAVDLSREQSDEVFEIVRAFITAEHPQWKDWPKQSLTSAWIGNETVSTFGVVPDIILYAATARQDCVPQLRSLADRMDNPIQRLVC